MTELPYPLSPGGMSPDRYLLNLLAAIVKKNGGELRIKVNDILAVTDQVLVRYPNDNLTEIVLKCAPKTTDLYVVSEAPAWVAPRTLTRKSQPPSSTPIEEAEVIPIPTQKVSTEDNLRLYLLEQEREERQQKTRADQERKQKVQAGVYPFRTESR